MDYIVSEALATEKIAYLNRVLDNLEYMWRALRDLPTTPDYNGNAPDEAARDINDAIERVKSLATDWRLWEMRERKRT